MNAGPVANAAPLPPWRTPLRLLARLLPGRGPATARPQAPNLGAFDEVGETPEARPPETGQPRRGNRRPVRESPARPAEAPMPEETEAEEPSPTRPSLGGATLPIVLARQPDSSAAPREAELASPSMPQEGARMPAVTSAAPESSSQPSEESAIAGAAEGSKTTWRAAMASLVNRLTPARTPANAAQRASAGAAGEAPAASPAGLEQSGGPALVHRRSADVTDIVPAPAEAEPAIAGAPETPAPVPGPLAAPEEAGEPLSPVLRERLEGLVDVPLTEVRIFRGLRARRVTSRLGADAVSAGTDVYLAPGAGNAETPSGRALLAHEVSHVAHRVSEPAPGLFDEEQAALRLEHAVQRQELPGLGMAEAGFPGPSPFEPEDVNLQSADPLLLGFPRGRRAAGPNSTGPERMLSLQAPPSVMGPAGGGNQIARAGRERSPGLAEPGGPAAGEASSGTSADRAEQEASAEEEANLIERAVEAVLRRLRRDGDLDRERRGSFRSEIGG